MMRVVLLTNFMASFSVDEITSDFDQPNPSSNWKVNPKKIISLTLI